MDNHPTPVDNYPTPPQKKTYPHGQLGLFLHLHFTSTDYNGNDNVFLVPLNPTQHVVYTVHVRKTWAIVAPLSLKLLHQYSMINVFGTLAELLLLLSKEN